VATLLLCIADTMDAARQDREAGLAQAAPR
jgi:hypothetical protein